MASRGARDAEAAGRPSDALPADGRRTVRFLAPGHYRLRVPPDLPPAPAPTLLAVHGYAQPPEEMFAYGVSVAPPGWVVLAPEGPSSFYRKPMGPGGAAAGGVGYGWVADPRRDEQDARNDGLIDACLASAAEVHALDRERLVLLGYSQGVGVAAHWWASRPDAACALVGLGGGVTAVNRSRLAALAGRAVLWVTGARDVAYPPAYTEGMLAALRDARVRVEPVMLPEDHPGLLAAARALVRERLPTLV